MLIDNLRLRGREGLWQLRVADGRIAALVPMEQAADDAGALLLAKDLGGLPVKVDTSLGDHELRADLTNTYGGVGSVSDVGNASTAPTADAAGTNKAITAGTDGPTCVN